MSVERFSLDANVLFYSIDSNHPRRHEIAAEIIERAALEHDCIVALQAYCEFIAAVTRKGKMTIEEAGAQVADWQLLFTTVYPMPTSLGRAVEAVVDHNLSFWDAMMWSTVRDNGGRVLLSEDLQDGRTLGGVRFRNPFTDEDPFRENV
ncbi:MAG: PIN domain-containing protein [Acidobacteriota bacterium]